jgi:hypothetical protein
MPGVWAAERCDCRALRLRRDRAKVAAFFFSFFLFFFFFFFFFFLALGNASRYNDA